MNVGTTIRQLVIGRLRWLISTGDEHDAEILALRHQILVLPRQINRPRFTDTRRDPQPRDPPRFGAALGEY